MASDRGTIERRLLGAQIEQRERLEWVGTASSRGSEAVGGVARTASPASYVSSTSYGCRSGQHLVSGLSDCLVTAGVSTPAGGH